MKRWIPAIIFLVATLPLCAQSEKVAESRRHYAAATKAYQASDYATYLTEMQAAAELRPGHQTILFNLAGAYALNGKPAESLAVLRTLADMGVTTPFEKEPDLKSVRELPEFAPIAARFAANGAPTNRATVAKTFAGKGLITEGVVIDTKTNTFYVSSVRERKIVAVDSKGNVTTFADAGSGLWSVLGMKIDPKRRILWAVSAAMPEMKDFDPATEGSSAVLSFSLDSHRLFRKVVLKPTEALKHSFGDLTLDAAGNVYVSDSGTPAIYLLRRATDTLEPLTTDARFVNLQGIALDEKRNTLYIADYSVGIYALDLATKELRLLGSPSNVTVLGIDGLYFDRGRLIAIQNGISPHRVARVTLDATAARITAVDVLEANHPLFDEPTLGVIERGRFYFIANSQWGAFDAKQNLPNVSSMKEPVILQLKLR